MADATTKPVPGGSAGTNNNNIGGTVIRNPDAVQKNILDFWGWLEANAKIIAVAVAALFVVAVGYLVMNFLGERKEVAAQEAYYGIEANFTKLQDGFERARMKALMPSLAADQATGDDKPATGDLEKDYGTSIAQMEKVAQEHAGTTAGAQAALLAGDVYLNYKMPEKAIAMTELVTKNLGSKNVLTNLALVQQGSALAAKGDCQSAIGSWQKVLDNKSAQFLASDVSMRSGLCFETMNQPEKAAEMYRKVTADGSRSVSVATAKSLLRALEINSKVPAAASPQ